METRKTRGKRVVYSDTEYKIPADSDESDSVDADHIRKSKIRDCNKEFAKRMTLLDSWSEYWSDYTTREGDAYPQNEAKSIIKTKKKITCPIATCRKVFTTIGGLRYHYARCNIERCFKCNVCQPTSEHKTRGDLLRHLVRVHHNQLPELKNEEQKAIAQAYLSSAGRVDKTKTRKSFGDHESQLNCRSSVSSYYELIADTYTEENLQRRPFKGWLTSKARDWEHVTYEIDTRRYLPPERESAHFRVSSSSSWKSISAGSSISVQNSKSSHSVIFYTGGTSTSSAWLPKPPINDSTVNDEPDVIAISVNSTPMDRGFLYKDCRDVTGCIQFWTIETNSNKSEIIDSNTRASLRFIIGHNYGVIFGMVWCPFGTSWEPKLSESNGEPNGFTRQTRQSRMGLLALACGDGQIRIISVPHLEYLTGAGQDSPSKLSTEKSIETVPIFRVKPIATLMPPGVGPSTDHQLPSCTAIQWGIHDTQRIIAAGYSNGFVALFDLANYSPILYSTTNDDRHVYQPIKSWLAHSLPVTGIAISSSNFERMLVVTGGRDKQIKTWNMMDLNSCLSLDKAPITNLIWDYRLRGIISATESAFTSFQNRVSYRYPTLDGYNALTVSTHRATVWGLSSSLITGTLATSDEAGEVFICPSGRPTQKRDKSHMNTHSFFTLLPRNFTNDLNQIIQSVDQNQELNASNGFGSGPVTSSSPAVVGHTGFLGEGCSRLEEATISSPTPAPAMATNCGGEIRISCIQEDGIAIEEPNEDEIMNDENYVINDYSFAERQVANKPAQFLLPIDHRAVETYADFKRNFGLEFVNYDTSIPSRKEQKVPKSCARAYDTGKIYCDRVCDYPFCSIKQVEWSPNVNTFQCLLSVSHIGLCRFDKVDMIDNIYRTYVDSLGSQTTNIDLSFLSQSQPEQSQPQHITQAVFATNNS